jgi:hypothetical protein
VIKMFRLNTLTDRILVLYLSILLIFGTLISWIFWIWKDGLLTPQDTAEIMIEPIITLGPLAILLDIIITVGLVRLCRGRSLRSTALSSKDEE